MGAKKTPGSAIGGIQRGSSQGEGDLSNRETKPSGATSARGNRKFIGGGGGGKKEGISD